MDANVKYLRETMTCPYSFRSVRFPPRSATHALCRAHSRADSRMAVAQGTGRFTKPDPFFAWMVYNCVGSMTAHGEA